MDSQIWQNVASLTRAISVNWWELKCGLMRVEEVETTLSRAVVQNLVEWSLGVVMELFKVELP